jgi:nucleoside-diphosphate-sugar epimerase
VTQPRILMTGSQGRIGTILTHSFAERYEVYGIDVKEPTTNQTLRADLSDMAALEAAFQQIGAVDYIIHLAANAADTADWYTVLRTNIIGTRNLYECAKAARLCGAEIKKIVYASTNYVTRGYEFDEGETGMISINDPVRPMSYYATSKVFGEAIARQFYEQEPHLASICLRIGAVLAEPDDPTRYHWHLKAWLSHRDLVQLVEKAMMSEVQFGIYYGFSNNTASRWDISNARRELGYDPQDNAALVPRKQPRKRTLRARIRGFVKRWRR